MIAIQSSFVLCSTEQFEKQVTCGLEHQTVQLFSLAVVMAIGQPEI
jgi:hypothetical protein